MESDQEANSALLSQTKNALAKEYVSLKRKKQNDKREEGNVNINDDPVYDLVDKQYLFIQVSLTIHLLQELFNKYKELQVDFSYRKMIIERKRELFREVHSTALNRLLENNHKQESLIKQLNNKLALLMKSNQNEQIDINGSTETGCKKPEHGDSNRLKAFSLNQKNDNSSKSVVSNKEIILVNKKKTINVYYYNEKNKKKTTNSSLNTTTTSQSKFNIEPPSQKISEKALNEKTRNHLTLANTASFNKKKKDNRNDLS